MVVQTRFTVDKMNKSATIVAVLQWFFTTVFQIDRVFFTYDAETLTYVFVKILYLLFIIICWNFIFSVYHHIKAGNELYKRGFRIFCVYSAILMFFLLLLWPGTWAWDDGEVLNQIQYYHCYPWQHIITSLYQMVLLQILPFPGGIILLQNLLIAVCVSFIIVKMETSYEIPVLKNQYLDIFIKLLPFLMPPVLMYQFSGYRIGLYVYIELTMLVIWYCRLKDNREWSWRYIILFCVLGAVSFTWRSESIIYLPFVILSIVATAKKVLPLQKKIGVILLIVVLFESIAFAQSQAMGNNDYKLVSILRPLTELVHISDPIADKEELDSLETCLDLDLFYANPEKNGEQLWLMSCIKSGYSNADYERCMRAFIKLCLKYPYTVIHERTKIFIAASGITGGAVTNISSAYNFYDKDTENNIGQAVQANAWISNKPVFFNLRKTMIHILGLQYQGRALPFSRLIWNVMLPLLVILYLLCKSIQLKNCKLLWIVLSVLIKVPIVILSEPAHWFMYFLSFYLIGYFSLIYGILIMLKKVTCQSGSDI